MKMKDKVYVGMHVHKDSVMVAVLGEGEAGRALNRNVARSKQARLTPSRESIHRGGI